MLDFFSLVFTTHTFFSPFTFNLSIVFGRYYLSEQPYSWVLYFIQSNILLFSFKLEHLVTLHLMQLMKQAV